MTDDTILLESESALVGNKVVALSYSSIVRETPAGGRDDRLQHIMAEQITITVAESPEDIAAGRELFEEYAAWLGFSLCFQGFDNELATLPGKYASPDWAPSFSAVWWNVGGLRRVASAGTHGL